MSEISVTPRGALHLAVIRAVAALLVFVRLFRSRGAPPSAGAATMQPASGTCLFLLLVACGSGTTKAEPDALVRACGAADDYGDLGAVTGELLSGDTSMVFSHRLDDGNPADVLAVSMFDGFAPFENGYQTGTFAIEGALTSYETCGLCVSVFADFIDRDVEATIFMAQSGTVEITSVEGNFTGSFTPEGSSVEMLPYKIVAPGEYDLFPECGVLRGGAVSWDVLIP